MLIAKQIRTIRLFTYNFIRLISLCKYLYTFHQKVMSSLALACIIMTLLVKVPTTVNTVQYCAASLASIQSSLSVKQQLSIDNNINIMARAITKTGLFKHHKIYQGISLIPVFSTYLIFIIVKQTFDELPIETLTFSCSSGRTCWCT